MKANALLLPVMGVALASAAPAIDRQRAGLKAANAAADAARARSLTLERAAADERDAAARARAREAAVAARINGAEAEITAALARVAIVDSLLVESRARLVERQAPMLRLVGALQSLARRPNALALVQPGSTTDIVHVRAMLGTMMPVVARRTAAVRDEIGRARKLRRDAATAAQSLHDGRAVLQTERLALVRMEGEHRLRSRTLDRSAMFESDRAIALGERAREFVDLMAATETDAATKAALATLPGPLPRPAEVGDPADRPASRFVIPPYRLPAAGRVVEGLGELSPSGVRSRGIALAAAPGAAVIAPAAGRILFARRFRGYAIVVIIDHGNGWSSALSGLQAVSVKTGDEVAQGTRIGSAAAGEAARIVVELRRRGVPIDLAQLLS